MSKEIERKFLVKNDTYLNMCSHKIHIVQAYLSVNVKSVVRVRITDLNAFLTVKSKTHGFVRDEWEYEIPLDDARDMIRCAVSGVIDKDRYVVPFQGRVWEVDCFHGPHEGLVVAEVELPDAAAEFSLPPFIGEEVTGNPLYYNSTLSALGNKTPQQS